MELLSWLRSGQPERIPARYPWAEAMAGYRADPGEGDVWSHTLRVLDALRALPGWRALGGADRDDLLVAALLHDVGRPSTTGDDGGTRPPRHPARGEAMARRILWEMGYPFRRRERVCALVRFHEAPFRLFARDDPRRTLYRISLSARCDHLALLAEADARGRVRGGEAGDDGVSAALFRELAAEEGCLGGMWPNFPSAHSRFLYFHLPGRNPYYPAHDDTRGTVTLVCGLPGAGKSDWIAAHAEHLPRVGFDEARAELGTAPGEPQGPVLQRALERAKEHMRRGEDYVFSATSLSRQRRSRLLRWFLPHDRSGRGRGYNYRVRLVYVESPEAVVFRRNEESEHPVPPRVLEGMLRAWEVPDLAEAHEIVWAVREAPGGASGGPAPA